MYGYILYSTKPIWIGNYVYTKETAERVCKMMNKDHENIGIKQKIKVKAVEITYPINR